MYNINSDSIENIKNSIYNKYCEIKDKYDEETYNEIDIFTENILNKYKDNIYENVVLYFLKYYFDIEYQVSKYKDLEESTQLQVCRNDDEFKKAVKDRYKTCIICDIYDCHKSSYQVAHIFDFSKCETELEKYDVNNGILLCSNMHKYFDDSLLKFVVDGEYDDNYLVNIVFCDSMCDYMFYKKYNGKKILFNKENIVYIEKKNNSNKNICI
jgi:predicted restriction endonuclease